MTGSGERRCAQAHLVAPEHDFCTICGQPAVPTPTVDGPDGGRTKREGLRIGIAVAVTAVVAALVAFAIWPDQDIQSSEPAGAAAPTTSTSTLARSTPSTTTTDATAISTMVPSSTAEMPLSSEPIDAIPAGLEEPASAARAAAVVYYTFGVPAEGYPWMTEAVAPEAVPSTFSMVLDAAYHRNDCTQIVGEIEDQSRYYDPAPQTFIFYMDLVISCPDGAPVSDYDGSILPLRIPWLVEVEVAPRPDGGYWATRFEPIYWD